MKIKKIITVVLFLVFTCFTANAFQKSIRVTSLEWPPYASETMTDGGTAVQSFKNILYAAQIGVVVDFFPWERTLMLAQKGTYEAIFPCWPEEVPEGFVATKSIAMSSVSVICHSSNKDMRFDNIEDLFKTKRIAIIRAYKYSDEIIGLVEKYKLNVVFASNEKLMIRMLNAERFDAAITDYSVMVYYAAKEKLEKPVEIKKLYDKPLVVAVKKDSGLEEAINFAITSRYNAKTQ